MNLFPSAHHTYSMDNTSLSHQQSFHEGDYLTDQRRLYRVLQIVPGKLKKRAAILEDCRTLDAALFRPRQLRRMRLQLVQPAPAPSTR